MKKLITAILLFTATLLSGETISADEVVGTTVINWSPGVRGAFEVSGTFGSGTITLYRWVGTGDPTTGTGEWVAFSGGAFTDDGGTEFFTGMRYLSIALSGSTSPSIQYFITPARQ